MNTSPRVSSVSLYKGHRFPAKIISYCVWLYFRFSLSFRDVEEMMAERGVVVSYESVREWCLKFGAASWIPRGRRSFGTLRVFFVVADVRQRIAILFHLQLLE
jgi:transposase-like protein